MSATHRRCADCGTDTINPSGRCGPCTTDRRMTRGLQCWVWHENGLSYREIAQRLGVGISRAGQLVQYGGRVYRYHEREQIPLPPGWRNLKV